MVQQHAAFPSDSRSDCVSRARFYLFEALGINSQEPRDHYEIITHWASKEAHDRNEDSPAEREGLAAAAAYLAFSDASATAAAPPRPAVRLRVAHGISALAIIVLFLAMHLGNHLTFVLGEPTYRAIMKAVRHV